MSDETSETMRAYERHTYRLVLKNGRRWHSWSFVCERGGIAFSASERDDEMGTLANLDFHYAQGFVPDYMANDPPSQTMCWLLGGPCWHDGTTLYATENLWPKVQRLLQSGNHEAIFRLLEREADDQI